MLSLKVYTYKDTASLKKYISENIDETKKFLCLNELTDNMSDDIQYEVDISSLIDVNNKLDNKFDYETERIIIHYNNKYNIKFIVKESLSDIVLERLPFIFWEKQKLFDYTNNIENLRSENEIIKIKDFDDCELEELLEQFNEKLVGHDNFKKELSKYLKEFKIFNKIGEHKILSIFLFGTSGIGKTQVARILHKLIAPSEKMIKLNFGNYSSEGALNSLIGSPRGYIGSEDGELNTKIKTSLSSVILIDEFEKCSKSVSNFFLELLEEGKYTDMLGEEHDLDGYIMIFTSNIPEEKISENISPEFLNRLNYVCKFNFLNEDDKTKYLKSRVNELVEKFNSNNDINIDDNLKRELFNINVSEYTSIREIENDLKKKFINVVEKLEK